MSSFSNSNVTKSGLSLIEVMITIAIFAILLCYVMPHKTFLRSIVVQAEIKRIRLICLYLRQKAIATGNEEVLFFDISANTYHYDGHTCTLPNFVCYGLTQGAKGPPSLSRRLPNKPVSFINNKIVFYPSGIIQSGTIYVTDTDKTILYALSVGVSQLSFVRMYRYDQQWTELT